MLCFPDTRSEIEEISIAEDGQRPWSLTIAGSFAAPSAPAIRCFTASKASWEFCTSMDAEAAEAWSLCFSAVCRVERAAAYAHESSRQGPKALGGFEVHGFRKRLGPSGLKHACCKYLEILVRKPSHAAWFTEK